MMHSESVLAATKSTITFSAVSPASFNHAICAATQRTTRQCTGRANSIFHAHIKFPSRDKMVYPRNPLLFILLQTKLHTSKSQPRPTSSLLELYSKQNKSELADTSENIHTRYLRNIPSHQPAITKSHQHTIGIAAQNGWRPYRNLRRARKDSTCINKFSPCLLLLDSSSWILPQPISKLLHDISMSNGLLRGNQRGHGCGDNDHLHKIHGAASEEETREVYTTLIHSGKLGMTGWANLVRHFLKNIFTVNF